MATFGAFLGLACCRKAWEHIQLFKHNGDTKDVFKGIGWALGVVWIDTVLVFGIYGLVK